MLTLKWIPTDNQQGDPSVEAFDNEQYGDDSRTFDSVDFKLRLIIGWSKLIIAAKEANSQ